MIYQPIKQVSHSPSASSKHEVHEMQSAGTFMIYLHQYLSLNGLQGFISLRQRYQIDIFYTKYPSAQEIKTF